MAITKGTSWYAPIDFGISEGLSNLLGTQIGAYNPAQSGTPGLDYSGSQERVNAINSGGSISPSGQVLGTGVDTTYGPQKPTGPGGAYPIAGGTPAPSGGGSNTGYTNPYDNAQPTGPSQQEIDAGFNPILDVLNQAESNLRSQQPGLIQEAEAQANASRQLLQNEQQAANEQLGRQETQTNQLAQSQTADQRRILQELQTANQQRFGGASSAGQAASELQGREFQRSQFGIQQNAQNALQQIGEQKQAVLRNYNQGLQQLEVNKQQAINQINRTFQDRLLEISARRGETESAKAQARLDALQQYRNQAYQINIARAQFENELRSQAQANSQQLSALEQQAMMAIQGGQGAYEGFAGANVSAIPGVEGQASGTTNPALTGQVSGNQDEGLFTGLIGDATNRARDFLGF